MHLLKIPRNRIMQNIKNEILYWIGNKSVTIDALHYFKKKASYALTVNTTLYINYGNRTYKIQESQWLH